MYRCKCGAITITNDDIDFLNEYNIIIDKQNVEYGCSALYSWSMSLETFKNKFPNTKIPEKNMWACDHCCNNYGIDLCSCGSGLSIDDCDCGSLKTLQIFGKPLIRKLWK